MVPPRAECYRPGLFARNENYFDDPAVTTNADIVSRCAGSLLNGYDERQSLALKDAFSGIFMLFDDVAHFVFVWRPVHASAVFEELAGALYGFGGVNG